MFKEFVTKGRTSSFVRYLKYKKGKVEGCPPYQDVGSVFRAKILFLNDTTTDRLRIGGFDLREMFNTGYAVFLDPCQVHQVRKCAIDNTRRDFVFTCTRSGMFSKSIFHIPITQ